MYPLTGEFLPWSVTTTLPMQIGWRSFTDWLDTDLRPLLS